MIRMTGSGWRFSLAVLSLAVAGAVGGTIGWADGPAATATAPAVSPNHAAAVEAFKKAYDLYQSKNYDQATVENDKALKLEPEFADAKLLRGLIQGKVAEGPGTGGTGTEGTTGAGGAEKARFLKAGDVAVLKVWEWNSDADGQLRGKIPPKTLEDFWNDVVKKQGGAAATSKEAHDTFVNATNFVEQVRQIRDSGDAKYMEKVAFGSDPAALLNYKKNIQPYVLQNCATAACHAGDKAGTFRLYQPANGANDNSLYTNFYILSMYANKDGKMIDRDHADTSLLLQYGMIKDKATKPHPGKVEKRYFTDSSDPRFGPMVDWIKSLAFPRPNYGIVYELPGTVAAAAPATAPATMPAKTQPGPKK